MSERPCPGDASPAESKWPCFWCGSMQAHFTGYPGGMSTVPACREHADEYTLPKARTQALEWSRQGAENEPKDGVFAACPGDVAAPGELLTPVTRSPEAFLKLDDATADRAWNDAVALLRSRGVDTDDLLARAARNIETIRTSEAGSKCEDNKHGPWRLSGDHEECCKCSWRRAAWEGGDVTEPPLRTKEASLDRLTEACIAAWEAYGIFSDKHPDLAPEPDTNLGKAHAATRKLRDALRGPRTNEAWCSSCKAKTKTFRGMQEDWTVRPTCAACATPRTDSAEPEHPEAKAIRIMAAHFEELGNEPCSECGYALNEIRDYVNELLALRDVATAARAFVPYPAPTTAERHDPRREALLSAITKAAEAREASKHEAVPRPEPARATQDSGTGESGSRCASLEVPTTPARGPEEAGNRVTVEEQQACERVSSSARKGEIPKPPESNGLAGSVPTPAPFGGCRESPSPLPGELALLHRQLDARDAELVAIRKVAEAAWPFLDWLGKHSGACCTFDENKQVVVTPESCRCDERTKQLRAALQAVPSSSNGEP